MYTFKCNGVRAAVHTGNGTVFTLDALTHDILGTLTPPLTDELPMGLRYAFAKFDGNDLRNAYKQARTVFEAMEEADAAFDRVTGAHVCACTDNAASVFEGFAAKMGDAERFALTILADEAVSADKVCDMIDTAKKCIPGVSVTVRCPIGSAAAVDGADGYILTAGAMSDFDMTVFASLPENAAVSLTFSGGEDLSAFVKSAYDAGCRKLSLVPVEGLSAAAAMDMYDKLSRTLTRMYRTVKDFVFLPFSFCDILPGRCILADGSVPAYAADSLPGYFGNWGLFSHMAEDIRDADTLQKFAEYAIVLQN